MSKHRQSERLQKLEELRGLTKRVMELAVASEMALFQINEWGGPQLIDFVDSENPNGNQARLDETLAGMKAASVMFASLAQTTPGFPEKTVKQALLRIATP